MMIQTQQECQQSLKEHKVDMWGILLEASQEL